MGCDAYKNYGGRSTTTAGLLGAAQGLGGMVGLGGFWKATSSSALQKITTDFKNIKEKWNTVIAEKKNQITQDKEEIKNEQLTFIQYMIDEQEEMMNENIQDNTLMIAITFLALLIVIIYLAVL